ncbi:NAC domain-containing protein 83-like isoform X2 [Andrographis paniculata]|uniref:NAC domain-containing protein 83-like isoform X2 n=1 Tax=Andrographis paniculata TaxID=175694 RepID=UPI0021E714E3|nr:NAC domain-containing protein 83-like isoform X2 [Andrographis paniculata]
MEKLFKFVGENGECKLNNLPPGLRFEPTDEEIVFQYLASKTFSHPSPPCVIPEIDPFTLSDLPPAGGDTSSSRDQERYFFCTMKTMTTMMRRRRRCTILSGRNGFWKDNVGYDKPIVCSKCSSLRMSMPMQLVGIKRTLVFYKVIKQKNDRYRAIPTNWIMHMYHIALIHSQNKNNNIKITPTSQFMVHVYRARLSGEGIGCCATYI